jgi:SH3 domain protein
MNHRLIVLLALACWTAPALAETLYVNDVIKVPVRSGASLDNKVIAMVASGDALEVMKRGEEWTQVRLADGKEGWMTSRHLITERPYVLQFRDLERKHADMLARAAPSARELSELRDQNTQLGEALEQTRGALESLRTAHEALQRDAANVVALRSERDSARTQLAEQTQQNRQTSEELTVLARSHNIRWFLSGAAVLLLGIAIGSSVRKKRHHSSLL